MLANATARTASTVVRMTPTKDHLLYLLDMTASEVWSAVELSARGSIWIHTGNTEPHQEEVNRLTVATFIDFLKQLGYGSVPLSDLMPFATAAAGVGKDLTLREFLAQLPAAR